VSTPLVVPRSEFTDRAAAGAFDRPSSAAARAALPSWRGPVPVRAHLAGRP